MTRGRSVSCLVCFLLLGAGSAGDAAAQGKEKGPKLGAEAYEGWRQYSAHCARCHGQDVVGNPVAADLLKSTRAGGPVAEPGGVRRRGQGGPSERRHAGLRQGHRRRPDQPRSMPT